MNKCSSGNRTHCFDLPPYLRLNHAECCFCGAFNLKSPNLNRELAARFTRPADEDDRP